MLQVVIFCIAGAVSGKFSVEEADDIFVYIFDGRRIRGRLDQDQDILYLGQGPTGRTGICQVVKSVVVAKHVFKGSVTVDFLTGTRFLPAPESGTAL